MGLSEQTEIAYGPDRYMCTGQIKILVWSGPKFGYAREQIVIGRDGNWGGLDGNRNCV